VDVVQISCGRDTPRKVDTGSSRTEWGKGTTRGFKLTENSEVGFLFKKGCRKGQMVVGAQFTAKDEKKIEHPDM